MNSLTVIAQAVRAITQRAKDPNSEISKALSGIYEPKLDSPVMVKLRTALAQSGAKPVRIVFSGSSTVAGSNATLVTKNFVALTTAALQAAYPSGGVEKPVAAKAATPSSASGIEAFNFGAGGTDASNYLTTADYTTIGTIAPSVIFHMVGSNDWANGVEPATYKANVIAAISAIDAKVGTPHVHILLHAYRRTSLPNALFPYSAYHNAIEEIAAANPSSIGFIDIERVGDLNDYSGTDPLNMLDTDNIHPTDLGHALIADTIIKAIQPRPVLTTQTVVTPDIPLSSGRVTSDSFSGGNVADINGRNTDITLGGSVRTWTAEPAANVAIVNGVMAKGAGTAASFAAVLPEPSANMEIGFTITQSPTGNNLACELHRQSIPVAGNPNTYRLEFQYGVMNLKKRVGNVYTTLQSGGSYATGDRITFRYFKQKIEVRKNGVVMLSATDSSITTAGYCGFAGADTTVTYGIDDVTVNALTY